VDPTEALKRIRGFLHSVDAIVDGPAEDTSVATMMDTLEALRDQVRALDEWLSRGGFLPDQWPGGRHSTPAMDDGLMDVARAAEVIGVSHESFHTRSGVEFGSDLCATCKAAKQS
jgi:hypothetical protein